MKTFLLVISLLFSVSLYSQKVTLLYVNSSWNKSNDYKHLSTLKNVRVLKVNYDDQPKKFKQQVKSVPAIILFDESNKLKKSMARWFINEFKCRPKGDTSNDK